MLQEHTTDIITSLNVTHTMRLTHTTTLRNCTNFAIEAMYLPVFEDVELLVLITAPGRTVRNDLSA